MIYYGKNVAADAEIFVICFVIFLGDMWPNVKEEDVFAGRKTCNSLEMLLLTQIFCSVINSTGTDNVYSSEMKSGWGQKYRTLGTVLLKKINT